ncbi:MAG: hypothetical protein H7062_19425, partial [Candidatus Saccharimonas sp.]|nr:hypothetical protein [Planctomycetaceae bacterium]
MSSLPFGTNGRLPGNHNTFAPTDSTHKPAAPPPNRMSRRELEHRLYPAASHFAAVGLLESKSVGVIDHAAAASGAATRTTHA